MHQLVREGLIACPERTLQQTLANSREKASGNRHLDIKHAVGAFGDALRCGHVLVAALEAVLEVS